MANDLALVGIDFVDVVVVLEGIVQILVWLMMRTDQSSEEKEVECHHQRI